MEGNGYPFEISGQALWQWRHQAQQQAIASDIDPMEVDWLLLDISDLNSLALRLGIFQNTAQIRLRRSLSELDDLWQRRIGDRTPVQYLVGQTPWRQFMLTVSPAVLIPRPETELVIDIVKTVIHQTPSLGGGHWADLGTGSGAIAIGLADPLPQATIHAVDISPEALAIARLNAEQNGAGDRVQFHQGNWFEPLQPWAGTIQGMISNPPYIPSHLIPTLQPEVAQHEPILALDGGCDGLDAIRHLVNKAPRYLQPGGFWLTELMAGQAEAVVALLTRQGCYEQVQVHPDLAGIERFVSAIYQAADC